MKSTFKNKLLLGAAVTALSFGVANASFAADEFLVDGDDSGTFTTTGPDETADTALDWDAGTNGAGTAVANHDLGVVASGTINFSADATVGDATATVPGIIATVTGQTLTIANNDGGGNARTATVANGIGLASGIAAMNLAINGSTVDGDALVVDINGDVNLGTGTLTITSQDNASTATVNVFGNLTSGTITLDENTSTVTLVLDGTSAQTVSGNIVAGTDNEGDITVSNAAGVTFSGTIGATGTEVDNILIASTDGTNSAATFTKQVDVNTAITLGNGTGTDTNTLTLNSSGASFAVNGALTGTAGDTDNIVVTGGNTVTLGTATAANNNIDLITVTGSSTLTSGQNIQAAAITVNSGSTLATTGGTVTSAIANSGTLQLANGSVAGNISGTGLLDVNNTGTVTGQIAQGTADIAAGATLNVAAAGDNSYNVGTTTFSGAGTVAFDNAARTVTGNFTNTTDGTGTITIADGTNTTAFVGNLGASTSNSLLALTVSGDAANVVTTTGNLFVDTITLDSTTSSLRLIGTGTQTVSGNIVGTADADGNLVIGNGTDSTNAIFNGEIGDHSGGGAARNNIASVTVDGLGTATFNGGVETSGNLVIGDAAAAGTATFNKGLTIGGTSSLDGNVLFGNHNAATANVLTGLITAAANQASTITLASKINATNNGFTLGDGAGDALTLLIKKTDTFDPTDAGGNGTAGEATDIILDATGQNFTRTAGTTLTIGLAEDTQAIDSGSAIQVAAGTGGAFATGITDGSIILRDTAFVDIQNNTSTATALNIRVVNKAASDVIGADATGAEAADTLLAQTNASLSGELLTIKGNLQGAGTAEAAQDIANSLAPTVDAGAVVGATAVVNTTAGITNTQLASLRDGTETGMMAGNISQGLRAWGQVFGQTGDQDERDGVAGFEVDTYGFAVGLDTETLAENWIWGLAFAYADTEVDSKGVNDTNTEIDSYQVSLYTNYDIDDRTYISGQVGYVWGDNDQTRSNIGGAGLVANSDYDSETWTARLEAGRKYAVGSNTILTPKALVNYQHYSADGYTETGTVGNAGLVVDSEDLNLFEIGVGVDASWDYQNADGSFWQPKIGVGVRHDLIGDEYETTSRFIGAGGNFNTDGFDPAQTTFNVGADVTYFSTTNWELSAGYDFEVKSDYDAHSGMLRAGYKF